MAKLLKDSKKGLVQRSSLLHIAAMTLADHMKSGTFKSLYRGQGIEFCDVREYLNGDNVRAIDWNVTARMGKPFIKQYEEDRELQVFFVIDRSLSMHTGTGEKSKVETASETAALLLLAAEHNSSPVGAVFFDGQIRFSTMAKSGRQHVMMLLSRLDESDKEIEKGSVLSSALAGAFKLLKKRSLVFVISDFRADGWQENLARLAVRNDVVALKITDSIDSDIPDIGTAVFFDPESGVIRKFPTSFKKFKTLWFEDNRNRTDAWKEFCLRHGAYPLILSTSEDPAMVLNRFFTRRGRK